MNSLAGQRVVVTGGTTGIGLAIAADVARLGARVFIVGRDPNDLSGAMAYVAKSGASIDGINADTSSREGVDVLFAAISEKMGGIDIIVCNAAIAADDISTMDDDDWRYAIEVNLNGYLACVKRAIEMFPERAQIVMIGSMSAEVREKGSSVYVAAKAGIQGFAASLRKEVNERGIRVVLIEPGSVQTDMASGSQAEKDKKVGDEEMLLPQDIAECVTFVLTRPWRCDVVELRVRPHRQLI